MRKNDDKKRSRMRIWVDKDIQTGVSVALNQLIRERADLPRAQAYTREEPHACFPYAH